jgi:Abortive infection C-terminus
VRVACAAVPNYLDFLVALDDYLRASVTGDVTYAHELHGIARDAGLGTPPQSQAPYWIGQLADRGYITHSLPPMNGRPAPPPGAGWTEDDLGRFNRYALTETGLAAAERERQARRTQTTDMTLNPVGLLSAAWLTDDWRESLRAQLSGLRGALDREDWTAAGGAAKNLVEAAALVVLERAGQGAPPGRTSVSTLMRAACEASDTPPELARRLASVVQVVAEMRNASDAGHGQATRAEVPSGEAQLAASAAVAMAGFLLAGE